MARYRRVTAEVLYTDKFRGLDLTEGEKNSFSSSVYMKNFTVTENYRLKKRCGYKKLADGIRADSCYHCVIGGADRFIYKNGSVMHALTLPECTDTVFDCGNDARVGYFSFGGAAYAVGRGIFLRFDGVSFTRVKEYVPKIAVTCSPSGGGTVLESLNVLSDKARISYSPDGVSTGYVLPSSAASVLSVAENGAELSPGSYSYDRESRTLSFPSPLAGGVPDSLEVTFRLADGVVSSMPEPGDKFCVYGGDRDTRVFAYGKDGVLRYSDVTYTGADPSYFPADNFITVGDGSERVTAAVRHYDRLIVFTERQTWFLSPSAVTYDGMSKPSFPLSPLNHVVGCAGGGAAYADNSPFTLSYDGIYVFGQSTVRDERGAKRISDRIAPYLSPAFLAHAAVHDHERQREIWMCYGGTAIIYNYGLDVFYCYDNVPAVYPFSLGENAAFFSGSALYAFDRTARDDDGVEIDACCETSDAVLDRTVKRRRLRRAGVVFTAENGAAVKLVIIPNRGDTKRLIFYGAPYDGGFDFGSIDFGHLSFLCGRKPVHTEQRIPLSSFESLKLRIECGGDGRDVTVSSVSLTVDGA